MAAATSAWAKPGSWALESEQKAATESATQSSPDPSPDFPSLATAAASKPAKKKKPQPQSLAEFAAGKPVSHGAAARYRPADEVLSLPTGPRERTAEELERPSRGFSYSRPDSRDETRRNGSSRVDSGPSRADEVDDWGSMKRSVGNYERREKGGFFDSQSRADEVDSWVSKRGGERRGGFDSWGRKKEEAFRADLDTWGRRREEVGGGGGGRPRLVLQPRTLPPADGSAEGNCEGEKNGAVGGSKGSNPFGLARPREEVLAEKGQDWKKLDEKLEEGKIKERAVDELGLGKKGWGLGNGGLNGDRAERSWRKEVASDAVASMYVFFFTPLYV